MVNGLHFSKKKRTAFSQVTHNAAFLSIMEHFC